MDKTEILNSNISDLNIGYELACQIKNDNLKRYTIDRLKGMNEHMNLYQQTDILLLVNSYVIDIVLFINVSNISKKTEEKDYFKGRLMNIINIFPDLKARKDLTDLL